MGDDLPAPGTSYDRALDDEVCMGRRGRVALLVALSLAVGAVAVLGIFLSTDWGLAQIREGLMNAINSGIAGRLEIERIDELTLHRVRARGVTIRAPDGKPAIYASRAVIDFLPSNYLRGRLGWEKAQIEGCEVHVTEDERGDINMERTFEGPKEPGEDQKKKDDEKKKDEKKDDGGDLDLRAMSTRDCVLHLGGGSMPTLRLVDLVGVMRVHVLPSGDTELRFDDYRGTIVKGLPTGELAFEQVKGEVHTGAKQLLHFDGRGRSEGARVSFDLDIDTKPTKVKIDALFPELSAGSLRALAIGTWSKLSSTLDLNVRHGKE